ncbi:HU family DNA-binding protein [Paenibacillus sp. FSL E2-0178]|uniref:HU family DNA-binding protein n=1 Tax=Paenibacillus sp. FSL E2-0178 TaxID=2921361 RepID=UPI003158F685
MNKQDLISNAVSKTGLDKKIVAQTTEALFEAIVEALVSENKVNIAGFGAFEVRVRSARSGVNLKMLKELKDQGVDPEIAKAQATIQIEATKVAAFKPSAALKRVIK